jgi:hypothetical protein
MTLRPLGYISRAIKFVLPCLPEAESDTRILTVSTLDKQYSLLRCWLPRSVSINTAITVSMRLASCFVWAAALVGSGMWMFVCTYTSCSNIFASIWKTRKHQDPRLCYCLPRPRDWLHFLRIQSRVLTFGQHHLPHCLT